MAEARDPQLESGGEDTWPWDVFLWSLITSSDQRCHSMNPSLPSFFESLISTDKNNRKRRLMELGVLFYLIFQNRYGSCWHCISGEDTLV